MRRKSSIEENHEKNKKEYINETQKMIIRGLINHIMMQVSPCNVCDVISVLEAIINPHLSSNELNAIKNLPVWGGLSLLHDIFIHPFPQNMYENDYSIKPPADIDLVSYTNNQGEIITEQKGLLSLTVSNDTTVPPVTKEAVLNYIQICITEKLETKKNQFDYLAMNTYSPHLSSDNSVLDLSHDLVWYYEFPYLCHFLNKNVRIKSLSLYLSADKTGFAQISDCLLRMNLIMLEIRNSYRGGPNVTTAIGSLFQNLRHLTICDILNDEGIYSIVKGIGKNIQLVSLKIDDHCHFTYWDEKCRVDCEINELEKYIIHHNDCIVELSKVIGNQTNLTNLSLKGRFINDIGMEAISHVITSSKINLSTLEIHSDRITNRGAFAIANIIKKSSSILSVTIHGALIKNEGAIAIAHTIACHSNCTSYSIFGHYISDAGAIGIAKALSKHPYLSLLQVGGSSLGYEPNQSGAKALVSHPNIDSIVMVNDYRGLPVAVKQILKEYDPILRAKYGQEIEGLNPMAPLLQKICFFALKTKPIIDQKELYNLLPNELQKSMSAYFKKNECK